MIQAPLRSAAIRERLEHGSMPLTEVGCWIWMGACSRKGYGSIKVDGRTRVVHRLAFEAVHGPIPDGHYICHKCDTPSCWNPDHLFCGTAKENIYDSVRKGRHYNASRTCCPKGHLYSEANTRMRSTSRRACKLCDKEDKRSRRRQLKNKSMRPVSMEGR